MGDIVLVSHQEQGSSGKIYGSDGKTLGEYRERGNRYEIFAPDGTRQGYGKRAPASPSTIDTYTPRGDRGPTIKEKR